MRNKFEHLCPSPIWAVPAPKTWSTWSESQIWWNMISLLKIHVMLIQNRLIFSNFVQTVLFFEAFFKSNLSRSRCQIRERNGQTRNNIGVEPRSFFNNYWYISINVFWFDSSRKNVFWVCRTKKSIKKCIISKCRLDTSRKTFFEIFWLRLTFFAISKNVFWDESK